MDKRGPGDSRSIENPPQSPDREEDPPVKGKTPGDAGGEDGRVSRPGDGLVTEEGVNERETRAP